MAKYITIYVGIYLNATLKINHQKYIFRQTKTNVLNKAKLALTVKLHVAATHLASVVCQAGLLLRTSCHLHWANPPRTCSRTAVQRYSL